MNPAAIAKGAKALWDFGKGAKAAGEAIMQFGNDVDNVAKKVIHSADLISKRWVLMQDIAFKTARTMAMSREQALQYNQQLINSTRELAAQYGVTAKELADFQQSYAEAVGRNVILTREQLAHMSALAKITDNATAQKLVDEFDKVGVGIARATAYTGRLQDRAKALGVSPAKATKMMADNIKLAASYSFRNGVNDIEKMSLRAASMRMDMQSIMNATEKFADIEGAISTSANIQMLGGSFAREFSNPMGAMYEAMADPAAFQERVLRTIEGKGSYDAKTGAVTFDPVTMRMMREMAKQLGMSAEDLNKSAMASVQNQKVEDELKAKGTYDKWAKNPSMLEAIKNLSRTNVDEQGEHYITILENGEQKQVKISELTEKQLEIATDNQLTQEGLWSDVQEIKDILKRVHSRAVETKSVKEAEEGMQSWWDAQVTNIQDIWMKPISDIYNKVSNWLGKQYFASGGIAKPVHAEIGTIVPGTSYYGDRVPAMLNSGEMVLNQGQQKSMFNLISSLALNGGMMYGVNKLGGKVGVGGLGSTMLMANVLGGGDAGIKEYIEAHFLNKFIKGMNPFKKSIEGVGTVAENAARTTSSFKSNWGELTSTLSKDWSKLTKKVSSVTKSFFTTGKIGKVTSYVGTKASQIGSFSARHAKTIGEAVGKYVAKPISSGLSKSWEWAKGTKFGLFTQRKIGDAQLSYVRAKLGYKQYVKPKTQEYSKLFKNLFNDGSKAQASKIASRYGKLGTPEVAMTGRATGVSQVAETATKEASTIAKAAGSSGKALTGLKTAGKMLGKKIPYIGTALAVGGAVSGMMDASSQFDKKVDEIERSGMSERDKARAKDRAVKEKNASYGGHIGSAAGGIGGMAAGAAAGAAIGSVVPVVGTAIGGLIGGALGAFGGEKLGGIFGKGIGSLFGGNNEKKFEEEQEKKFKSDEKSLKSGEDVVNLLKSIDGKLGTITKVGIHGAELKSPSIANIGLKGAEIGLSAFGPIGTISKLVSKSPVVEYFKDAVKALPDFSSFLKVEPSKQGETQAAPLKLGKTDINLNVSGTIKLEGNGKSVDFDISKLLETNEFKSQLLEMIQKEARVVNNAGKDKKESDTGKINTWSWG